MSIKTVRLTLISVLVFVLLLVVAYLITTNVRHQIKATSIGVDKVIVSDQNIKVTGVLVASAERFRGYKYEIRGNNIFIKFYTSYVSWFRPGGDNVNINIDGDFKDIKNVYLEDASDKKVIWSKQ